MICRKPKRKTRINAVARERTNVEFVFRTAYRHTAYESRAQMLSVDRTFFFFRHSTFDCTNNNYKNNYTCYSGVRAKRYSYYYPPKNPESIFVWNRLFNVKSKHFFFLENYYLKNHQLKNKRTNIYVDCSTTVKITIYISSKLSKYTRRTIDVVSIIIMVCYNWKICL